MAIFCLDSLIFWGLAILIVAPVVVTFKPIPTGDEYAAIGAKVETLYVSGNHMEILKYCEELQQTYGTLDFNVSAAHSIYSYLGASLYSVQKTSESIAAFKKASQLHPNNTNILINLGEVLVQTFHLDEALEVFNRAHEMNDRGALPRAMRTIGWSADWKNFELYSGELEQLSKQCQNANALQDCWLESASGLEYTDASLQATQVLESRSGNTKMRENAVHPASIAKKWGPKQRLAAHGGPRRLRVGFVSSDFDVHPVSQLIRGLIQFIDKRRIELYCFGLQEKSSWWGENITANVEHFVKIHKTSHFEAANIIASYQIEILIDLNGHTMFSGLPIFAFRPAPVQISWLGLPTTTGAEFMDYFLGDYVSNPPELRDAFTESLLLMPPPYIASDYAQLVGEVADWDVDTRSERSCFNTFFNNATIDDATVLLATLSNSQKMDPSIFHVWMNLLSTLPGAKLLLMEYRGAEYFLPNLQRFSKTFGIEPGRLVMTPQQPYIHHLQCKTAIDLALDTIAKNGHTTGLDALWAGVPVLSMGGRPHALSRAAESMTAALKSEVGLSFSLKEYEDIALRVLKAQRLQKKRQKEQQQKPRSQHAEKSAKDTLYSASPLLRQWREEIIRQRRESSLFNTRLFTQYFHRYMESVWELQHLETRPSLLLRTQNRRSNRPLSSTGRKEWSHFHVFPAKSQLPAFAASFQPLITTQMPYTGMAADIASRYGGVKHTTGKDGSSSVILSHVPLPNSGIDYRDPSVIARLCTNPGRNLANHSDYEPIPAYVFDGRLLMLNVGGVHAADGWLLVNKKTDNYGVESHVDIMRDMDDLYGLPDHSVSALYCSHTLEHQILGDSSIVRTLEEWFRVIRPGGLLLVSVPDLATLSRMFLDKSLALQQRWQVVKMIYGAQADEGDYHHSGFDEDILTTLLKQVGFCDIQRVGRFNMAFTREGVTYYDTSESAFGGYFISLNLVARLCPAAKPGVMYDGFSINHAAEPYRGERSEAYKN